MFTDTDEGCDEEYCDYRRGNARRKKISSLNYSMMEISRLLADAGYERFDVHEVSKDVWDIFLIVFSYCCDIPERKDI